jgi:hypothetical protein
LASLTPADAYAHRNSYRGAAQENLSAADFAQLRAAAPFAYTDPDRDADRRI